MPEPRSAEALARAEAAVAEWLGDKRFASLMPGTYAYGLREVLETKIVAALTAHATAAVAAEHAALLTLVNTVSRHVSRGHDQFGELDAALIDALRVLGRR